MSGLIYAIRSFRFEKSKKPSKHQFHIAFNDVHVKQMSYSNKCRTSILTSATIRNKNNYDETLNNTTMRDSMYPIPKVHLNHEFLAYIIIMKGCFWKIQSINRDLPLVSNRIQSIHEISIVFQKRNHNQIWKHVLRGYKDGVFVFESS